MYQPRVTFASDNRSGFYSPVAANPAAYDFQGSYQTPPPSPSVANGRPAYLPSHLFQSSAAPQNELGSSTDELKNWPPSARKSKFFDDQISSNRFTPEKPNLYSSVDKAPLATSTPGTIISKRREDSLAPPTTSIYEADDAETETLGSPMHFSPPSTPYTSGYEMGSSSNLNATRLSATPYKDPSASALSFDATPSTPGSSLNPAFATTPSQSQITPVLDDRWVTVFGFPPTPEAIKNILRQFQQYGEIVRYHPGEGNWIHIQYQTKLQAQKALTKNTKLLDKGLMIGVCPCTEQKLKKEAPVAPRSLGKENVLGRAEYKPASGAYAVNPQTDAPTASTGIWSKLSEYVFSL